MSSDAPEPAIRARTDEWQLGAPGTGLVWLDETLVGSTGDGRLHFAGAEASAPVVKDVHGGAILAVATDPVTRRVVTGGDDGRLVATNLDGSEELLARPGRWIDAVAASREGQIAAAIGKQVVLWRDGELGTHDAPSTAAGLAFDHRGSRLAAAHYGGVSLFDTAHPKRAARQLAWKGSHIRVSFSPNAKFVVSVMSENALHGWRIKDGANMAMSGYPAKPRAISWSADGALLASSGADGAIVWSFAGRDGPMGTSAVTLGDRHVRVTALSWHPEAQFLALGYRDGAISLCRAEDGATLSLRAPDDEGIGYLAFSDSGDALGAMTEAGHLIRLHLDAL